MAKTIFSGPARVALQGDQVLRFIRADRQSAEYRVLGFRKPVITVVDYRKSGLDALAYVRKTYDKSRFARQFNRPCHVTVVKLSGGALRIELRDAEVRAAENTLWIANGIKPLIPLFDYIVQEIAPRKDDKLAFLSLYRRPSAA